jgi:hypothetical protein
MISLAINTARCSTTPVLDHHSLFMVHASSLIRYSHMHACAPGTEFTNNAALGDGGDGRRGVNASSTMDLRVPPFCRTTIAGHVPAPHEKVLWHVPFSSTTSRIGAQNNVARSNTSAEPDNRYCASARYLLAARKFLPM